MNGIFPIAAPPPPPPPPPPLMTILLPDPGVNDDSFMPVSGGTYDIQGKEFVYSQTLMLAVTVGWSTGRSYGIHQRAICSEIFQISITVSIRYVCKCHFSSYSYAHPPPPAQWVNIWSAFCQYSSMHIWIPCPYSTSGLFEYHVTRTGYLGHG